MWRSTSAAAHVTSASRSSRTARSWSEACLRTTPSVSSTALSSRSRISSAISVRAQSTDSAIDGAFFSSRSRSRADGRDQLAGDPLLEVGDLGEHDLALALLVRVVEVQVEAAPLERLGQLTGGVGGEHDERPAHGGQRAELGDGDLEVGEHLEQQPLDLDVGLVDLVDEQHRRLLAPDRGEQRPGQQELVGEDVVVGLRPAVVTLPVGTGGGGLDAQQLLLVVPLVERARLVQPLVALQPDQLGAGDPRDRLGQLGLADPGRALDQQRLLEHAGEVGGRRRGRVGQVAGRGEPFGDLVGRGEPGHNDMIPHPGYAPARGGPHRAKPRFAALVLPAWTCPDTDVRRGARCGSCWRRSRVPRWAGCSRWWSSAGCRPPPPPRTRAAPSRRRRTSASSSGRSRRTTAHTRASAARPSRRRR